MLKHHWVDFGQQERLTVRLKELIRNYPRGIGIIKEFIQNADDAGAGALSVILDLRAHPTDKLSDPRMKALMGPAILIGNESVFSAQDFQSIQHIGESNKTESGPKTGRFGLGFNTCYNVTDYPSFVTGEDIVCFDPHQNAIAHEGGQPGVRGALEDAWQTSPDWLDTFTVAGLTPNAPRYDGTIFRLPLRTPAQAMASEISKECFGEDAFDEIVSQLKIVGPELLLFTKHLLSIAVIRVDGATGEAKTLLRISTQNAEAVSAARERIFAAISGLPLPELLAKWREDPSALPCVTYTQDFEVDDNGQIGPQSWRVTNGLFSDPQNKLLDAAQAMLAVGEKAIPWAGAAAKLVAENGALRVKPIDGHMYCGLPLSDETPLPVHVNGYFDLDSSRSALSADRNLIGANRTRVEWNEQLMQHGVATAYARLLTDLLVVGEPDIGAFYGTFPNLNIMKSQLHSILGRSVYSAIAKLPIIRACASNQADWYPIGNVWIVPERLKLPLSGEERAIADPSLPTNLRLGFETVGETLNILTAKSLRDFLYTNQDIDSLPEDSTRPCLREKAWVEELLRFCITDGGEGRLKGLPLALHADGRLHTFGYAKTNVVFSASRVQRQIFADFPRWFIDPDFENRVGLQEDRPSKFLRMGPPEVVTNLGGVLGKDAKNRTLEWEPNGDETPNATWLAELFAYFASVPAPELLKVVTDLQAWPLLPDQRNSLHPLSGTAPMWRPSEPNYKKLVAALEVLGVPLLTGPSFLLDAGRQFAAAHPKCLDAEITGARLVAALSAHENALKEHCSSYDSRIHDPLLSFLSEERFLASYTEPILAQLRSLPIFPTMSDEIAKADAPNVFLSTNYIPPSCSPSVVLLKPGPENRWKKLLHRLRIERLDRQTLIEKVLIPNYGTVTHSDQVAILRWIRDHLMAEVTRLDKEEPGAGQKLFEAVRQAELVSCMDGKLHRGAELYDPREQVIRDILGDRAAIPNLTYYAATDSAWIPFFEQLGMSKSPRAQDLLDYIDALVLLGISSTSAVAERLMEVLEFLQRSWTALAAVPIVDGTASIHFSAALKNRAWLPAQRNARYADEYPGFVPPEDRLYRPSEIYPSRLIHQIGSALPVLPGSREVEREVRSALGMPAQAPLDAVLKHFDRLIELWQKPGHDGIKLERLEASLKDIYRYLGVVTEEKDASERIDLAGKLQVIQDRYQGKACIWDSKTEHFWKPTHVYSQRVSFFEPRRTHVSYSEDRINTGLTALGRRLFPTSDDYREFLRDLHAEFIDDALNETERSQVLHALWQISADPPSDMDERSLPLLAQDGRLRLGGTLLWKDTIRWQDKIDLSIVPLVHEQVPPAVITRAGVLRLSEHLVDELTCEPKQADGHGLDGLCECASRTIRSGQFADAVRRLIRHESGPNAPTNADSISNIRIAPVVSIQLETVLKMNGCTIRLGDYEASSFFRGDDATLFVAGSSERQLRVALAKAINAMLNPPLSDLAVLQEILRANPEEIQGILSDFEIPGIELADESQVRFEDEQLTWEPVPSVEEVKQESVDIEHDVPQIDREEDSTNTGDSGEQAEDGSSRKPFPSRDVPTTPSSHLPGAGTRPQEWGRGEGTGHLPSRGTGPRSAGGTDNRPPITPGTGKSGWDGTPGRQAGINDERENNTGLEARQKHQRSRIVTYVEGPHADAEDHTIRDSEADAIGDAAVDYVFGIEARAGRQPIKMDHNNEGFDIIARDPDGQPRYIEVKGIDGVWGESGAGITRSQFLYAQSKRDRFWLYIVENARSESPTLYCINDPATQITQYRFDAGWKSLAEVAGSSERSSSAPTAGMRVFYDEGAGVMVSGTITQVERQGLIVRIHIHTDSGAEVKKFMNASMRFSKPEEEVEDATNAAGTD